MNKIAFVTGVNSRKSGGVFFTIANVTNELAKSNEITVIGREDEFTRADSNVYSSKVKILNYHTVYQRFLPIGFSFDLKRQLKLADPDIIHQQGIWMYYSKAALEYKKKNGAKIILQPHGMLDEWAFKNSNMKKRLVLYFYENENIRTADCLHALNLEEYSSLRKMGFTNPIAIIPNGVYLPREQKKKYTNRSRKTLLFVGRIHPKKGLELLIDAVNLLRNRSFEHLDEWSIRIAGWNQGGHEEFLIQKIKKLGLTDYFDFIGAVFDGRKEEEFLQADAFILPSYSEGLPMSVLEAWSYQLPVLMTKECNLLLGFSMGAAMELQLDAEKIAQQLGALFSMDEASRVNMGRNGFNLVQTHYTWEKVAEHTNALYEWVLGRTAKPDFVYIE